MDWEEGELGHVLEKQKKDDGGCGLYRTILHQGAAQRPILPVACDVTRSNSIVISEPVLSKKILALRCEVPIHMDGEAELVTYL
jgi:hypothetical protein